MLVSPVQEGDRAMKKRYSVEQIIKILGEVESGQKISEVM